VKKIAVIFGLFTLVLLYFNDSLSGQRLLVERDLTTFFYPFRFIWVETVRNGNFPFWNPYIKCGVPLFATVQPAVLYPLSLLYLLLPLDLAFNWTIILHFFLAAVFTYMLMRELGTSTQGALAAVLAFLFSGYLISVHNLLNTLLSVSWFPLVIFCGYRLVQRGQARWAVASGASLCFMFLGGGVEIVFFALASLLALCLYPQLLPIGSEQNRPNLQQRLALLGLAVILFLGLALVQLLPFLEFYRHSDRFGGMPVEQAMRWSLAPRDLIYFLLPDLYGSRTSPEQYWKFQNYLKTIYMGPLPFFLAGIYFVRRGRKGFPLLVVLGVALVFALGGYAPLYPFFYRHFPLFASLRYPAKFLFLFIFCLCVTAGFGLDLITRRFTERRQPASVYQWLLMAVVLVLAGMYLATRFAPEWVTGLVLHWWGSLLAPSFHPRILHNFSRLLVVTIFALIIIFFGLRPKLGRTGGHLLLILLTLDLFLGNRGFAYKLDATKFHAKTDIIRTLEADSELFRLYVLPEVEKVEVVIDPSYEDHHRIRKESLAVDLMMEHHLFDIRGYNVPVQPRYEKVIGLINNNPLAKMKTLLDMLNVKYVLAPGSIELPGYAMVQGGPGTSRLYVNNNYLPRAFLVKKFRVLQSDKDFALAVTDPNFNPRQMLLIEKVPVSASALSKKPARPDHKPEVKVVSYENNRVLLEVSTPEAAFLFMSEAYYPGWKAYVDGRQEEILRANYVFRAIPLGPGSHKVEVVMEPLSFKIGLAVSGLTIVLLLTGWAFATIRKQRA
jgi:hypothetical protein